jgi:hypothetical protein
VTIQIARTVECQVRWVLPCVGIGCLCVFLLLPASYCTTVSYLRKCRNSHEQSVVNRKHFWPENLGMWFWRIKVREPYHMWRRLLSCVCVNCSTKTNTKWVSGVTYCPFGCKRGYWKAVSDLCADTRGLWPEVHSCTWQTDNVAVHSGAIWRSGYQTAVGCRRSFAR